MRQEKSRKEATLQELDSQLASLLLIRKSTNEGSRSLMHSLADQLLFSEDRAEQMLRSSLAYFEECLQARSLPSRLNYFYDSEEHANAFRQQPELAHFDKVHLQLLSQKHQCRICVYSLTPDQYLSELIINNNHSKHTQLSKVFNHYDPVYTQESLELANDFKDMIVERLLQRTSKDEQPLHVEVKQPSKRKHKKSLSVCDESEYKEFEYIFNHPGEVKVKNLQLKKQQQELDCEQEEESKLIKECCDRKGSISLQKEQLSSAKSLHGQVPFLPNAFAFLPPLYRQYSADYRLIQSERNFSTHSISPSKVEDPNRRYTGRLKFFDEVKNYGFIVMDEDCSDIFVHYDDLEKANIDKDFMRSTKHGHIIRFEFTCMEYIGKYNRSRKAVNLVLLTSGFLPF